jgi:SNF2 family DNA or RNA helicase
MLRRTKEAVAMQLPGLHIQTIEVPWKSGEQRFAAKLHALCGYTQMPEETFTSYDSLGNVALASPMTRLLRARQLCIMPSLVNTYTSEGGLDQGRAIEAGSKLVQVAQTLVQRYDNGHRKIVFCHFHKEMDTLRDLVVTALPEAKVAVFDGRITLTRRKKLLTEDAVVLIMQLQTSCEGLNLQMFSEVYFVSAHWNPEVESQAIARCHRMGQTRPVSVFRYEMRGFGLTTTQHQEVCERVKRRVDDSESDEEVQPPMRWISLDQYVGSVQRKKRKLIDEILCLQ